MEDDILEQRTRVTFEDRTVEETVKTFKAPKISPDWRAPINYWVEKDGERCLAQY